MQHTVKHHRLYKYQTDEDSVFFTQVKGFEAEVEGGWVRLEKDGRIFFRKGYSWDGCTLVPDVPGSEAPSQVHDGLYQLVKAGWIPKRRARKHADRTFRDMLRDNEVSPFVCWLYYTGVRAGGWAFC